MEGMEGLALGTAGFSSLHLTSVVVLGRLDMDRLLWDTVFMLVSEGRNWCRGKITTTKSYCATEDLFGVCICLYRIRRTKLRKIGSSCEVLGCTIVTVYFGMCASLTSSCTAIPDS